MVGLFKKKHNLNGRICVEYLFYFGLSSIIIVKVINPFLILNMNKLTENTIVITGIILAIIFISDFILSANAANSLKKKVNINMNKFKDST